MITAGRYYAVVEPGQTEPSAISKVREIKDFASGEMRQICRVGELLRWVDWMLANGYQILPVLVVDHALLADMEMGHYAAMQGDYSRWADSDLRWMETVGDAIGELKQLMGPAPERAVEDASDL